jgi:hypothetical protein
MQQLALTANIFPLLARLGIVVIGGVVGYQVAQGARFELVLFVLIAASGFLLVHPERGLYLFCFILILTNYEWYVEGGQILSPNNLVIGIALLSWVATVLRYGRFSLSTLYWPGGLALLVAWLNFARYGPMYFNLPFILSEAFLLFLLSYHLIRRRWHLSYLLLAFALAFIFRNAIDVGQAISSWSAYPSYGAIRADALWLGGTSTTGSEWRSLFLPLFLTMVLVVQNRKVRNIFRLALFLDIAWLALAGTRVGILGVFLALVSVLLLLPAPQRKRLFVLAFPLGLLVIFLVSSFGDVWTQMLERHQLDLDRGWEAGRVGAWRLALSAFLENPLWGHSAGPSHSFFLGAGRAMGLVFLIPFCIALGKIWRHGAWLKRQPLDQMSLAFVLSMQACLLVAIPINFISTTFNTAFGSMFFWLLAGAHEALYLDVRSGRYAIAEKPAESPESV